MINMKKTLKSLKSKFVFSLVFLAVVGFGYAEDVDSAKQPNELRTEGEFKEIEEPLVRDALLSNENIEIEGADDDGEIQWELVSEEGLSEIKGNPTPNTSTSKTQENSSVKNKTSNNTSKSPSVSENDSVTQNQTIQNATIQNTIIQNATIQNATIQGTENKSSTTNTPTQSTANNTNKTTANNATTDNSNKATNNTNNVKNTTTSTNNNAKKETSVQQKGAAETQKKQPDASSNVKSTETTKTDSTKTDSQIAELSENDETTETEEEQSKTKASRSVTLKVGDYLEIDYPGKGWVYLGSTDYSKNLSSSSRNVNDKDTHFTLLAKKEGTSILHFFKEDILTSNYIDDYISVTIEKNTDTKAKPKHVTAPSYAEIVPLKPGAGTKDQQENDDTTDSKTLYVSKTATETNTQTPVTSQPKTSQQNNTTQQTATKTESASTKQVPTSVPEITFEDGQPKNNTVSQQNAETNTTVKPNKSADELLQSARENVKSKNYQEALDELEAFLSVAEKDKDEALFLLGQVYESYSSVRDIKKAVESYEKILEFYKTSKLWDDANKRARYLKHFYINVM